MEGEEMKWLFSFVWRKRLERNGEQLRVVKVRGWRTALVESNMTSRQTIQFMFKFFRWHI